MATRGGKRPGAGRPPGAVNKATMDLKLAAQEHGEAALELLVKLMVTRDDNPSVQLGAAKELLDRGFGRASQVIAGDADNPITYQELVRRIVHTNDRHGSGI